MDSFFGFLSVTSQKLGYFIIFDGNHLPKTIELDIEEFVLIIDTSFEVLKFKVENLFEFVSQLIKFLAFFFVGFLSGDPLFFDKLL